MDALKSKISWEVGSVGIPEYNLTAMRYCKLCCKETLDSRQNTFTFINDCMLDST